MRAAGLAASLWAISGATAAAQDQAPRGYIVAVSSDPVLENTTARVGAAARAALRRQNVVEWQTADERYLGYGAELHLQLEEAKNHFDEGRAAYLNLQLEEGIRALEAAVRGFDEAAAAVEDPLDLAEALLYLGACQTFLDRHRAARATFLRLHVQMPHLRPDPEDFGPEVVEAYERAAPPDASSPSSTLEVDSEPPGAVAYVDFLARGRTPVTVTGLVSGQHMVRAGRPGAPSSVQSATVRTRQSNRVTLSLSETSLSGRLGNLQGAMANSSFESMPPGSTTRIFAEALGVDVLGVIRVTPASASRVGLELNLLDRHSGEQLLTLSREVPTEVRVLEPSVDELVATALGHAFDPNAREAGMPLEAGLGEPYGPTDEGASLFEEWYFWAAVGGGVAVVAGIVLFLVLNGDGTGSDDGGQLILRF